MTFKRWTDKHNVLHIVKYYLTLKKERSTDASYNMLSSENTGLTEKKVRQSKINIE